MVQRVNSIVGIGVAILLLVVACYNLLKHDADNVSSVEAIALCGAAALAFGMYFYRRQALDAIRTELRQLEEIAVSDNLTGLGNHRAFYEDFEREISRARRHSRPLTLALVDVDDFKAFNDTRGYKRGDDVLVRLAQALGSVRIEDRAYRIGGDEFAILLAETTVTDARNVFERVHRVLRRTLSGVTISVGLCELMKDWTQRDFYECADAALYAARHAGRNRVVDFNDVTDSMPIFTSRKSSALRKLLTTKSMEIAFQPIWDVHRGTILGFEALARPDESLGLNGPQEAFDVAERLRVVADLDILCATKAFEIGFALPRNLLLFLNVAPETIARSDFRARYWAERVATYGLQPSQIVVELTERRIDDPGRLAKNASELREHGIRLALDDTGSGSAGLEILSKLSFDFIKIDRSVLTEAPTERRARGILAGVVAIARESGSLVIVEGVESVEQLEFLRGRYANNNGSTDGIYGAQGYLLGRPRIGPPSLAAFLSYGRSLLVGSTIVS